MSSNMYLGEEVEVMSEPILVVPLSMNWMLTTPTSSVAVAERGIAEPVRWELDEGNVQRKPLAEP